VFYLRRLHAPKIWIECEVRDVNGKLIHKRKFRGMSWVGNIVGYICGLFKLWVNTNANCWGSPLSPEVVNDTGNTARGVGISSGAEVVTTVGGCAPAGDTSAGIVVGSSSSPVTINDYALGGLIAHGTGAGQLLYGATTVEDLVKTANSWTFRIVRAFTNGSGATITVREIGLYLRIPYTIMFARDVLPTPIDIPNGATLTVRYIISHTI